MEEDILFGVDDALECAARVRLTRIADTLGCDAAAFFNETGVEPVYLSDTDELLHIWSALKTDAGRQAVLKLIRVIVAAE